MKLAMIKYISLLLLALTLPSCGKKGSDRTTAASLGLGAGIEDLGPDPNGNLWFRAASENPDKPGQRWMYNPVTKTLYDAAKNEKSGEWDLKERPEITAKDLGLAADTIEVGKDTLGRYWFKIPSRGTGSPEQSLVYNPKTKILFDAKKDQKSGEWALTPKDAGAKK
jgi:hypothetical protein